MKNYNKPQTAVYPFYAMTALCEASPADPIGGNLLKGGLQYLKPEEAR